MSLDCITPLVQELLVAEARAALGAGRGGCSNAHACKGSPYLRG